MNGSRRKAEMADERRHGSGPLLDADLIVGAVRVDAVTFGAAVGLTLAHGARAGIAPAVRTARIGKFVNGQAVRPKAGLSRRAALGAARLTDHDLAPTGPVETVELLQALIGATLNQPFAAAPQALHVVKLASLRRVGGNAQFRLRWTGWIRRIGRWRKRRQRWQRIGRGSFGLGPFSLGQFRLGIRCRWNRVSTQRYSGTWTHRRVRRDHPGLARNRATRNRAAGNPVTRHLECAAAIAWEGGHDQVEARDAAAQAEERQSEQQKAKQQPEQPSPPAAPACRHRLRDRYRRAYRRRRLDDR